MFTFETYLSTWKKKLKKSWRIERKAHEQNELDRQWDQPRIYLWTYQSSRSWSSLPIFKDPVKIQSTLMHILNYIEGKDKVKNLE